MSFLYTYCYCIFRLLNVVLKFFIVFYAFYTYYFIIILNCNYFLRYRALMETSL